MKPINLALFQKDKKKNLFNDYKNEIFTFDVHIMQKRKKKKLFFIVAPNFTNHTDCH
jgi:hypothetical protein